MKIDKIDCLASFFSYVSITILETLPRINVVVGGGGSCCAGGGLTFSPKDLFIYIYIKEQMYR